MLFHVLFSLSFSSSSESFNLPHSDVFFFYQVINVIVTSVLSLSPKSLSSPFNAVFFFFFFFFFSNSFSISWSSFHSLFSICICAFVEYSIFSFSLFSRPFLFSSLCLTSFFFNSPSFFNYQTSISFSFLFKSYYTDERYSFSCIAPLYPRYVNNNSECLARRYQLQCFSSWHGLTRD